MQRGGGNGPNVVEHDKPCAVLYLIRGVRCAFLFRRTLPGIRGLSTHWRGHMIAPATAGRTSCSMRKVTLPRLPWATIEWSVVI